MPDRIDQLTDLLRREPGDAFCLYALAQEYAKRGDALRAIEFYDRSIAADASSCYAYFHKARVQQDAGDVEAAVQTLRDGLHRAKEVGDTHAASEIAAFLDELT